MAALYTVLSANVAEKLSIPYRYIKPCNAMIKFENRITAHPTGVYFTVFSLKDKCVRVSPSTRTGRHLTSTSPYINVGVSAVYMFIVTVIIFMI